MTLKNSWVTIAFAALLTLPLTACKDAKTLQENEQLKAKVAELQKDNGQIGNDLDAMTSSRDDLAKENEVLKAQLKACKPKHSSKKSVSHKHHHK
jgi:septal ring factor EnvC (AmiA/AmiB activator)